MSHELERQSTFLMYVRWHYGEGLQELFKVAGNFLWFISHFFSFRLLSSTLFAPWRKLGETYHGGLDIGEWASTVVVNTMMRIVGFVTRSVVLIVGFISYVAVAIFSFCISLIWVLAPLVLVGSIILSATFFAIDLQI